MAVERRRVAVLFGGRSVEHVVSVVSAQGVLGAMDQERFEPVAMGITRNGAWLTPSETEAALRAISPGQYRALPDVEGEGALARLEGLAHLREVDMAFPLVHGAQGEDGTLQGLLELAAVPYVGAGVAASALGMDKALQKAVFRQAGLPVPDWITVLEHEWRSDPVQIESLTAEKIGYPCFVKPANGGSSIGTSQVLRQEELAAALENAQEYDRKALIERAVKGREIECSVLGNDAPCASPLGEIVPNRPFYDYQAKYVEASTELIVPARLPKRVEDGVRELALAAFRAIGCMGMARVDFFLEGDEQIYVNEINTVPGFTPISMYPKLWEAAGLSYPRLITCLLELAMERWEGGRRGV